MKMRPPLVLAPPRAERRRRKWIDVDLFAGGGGASEGKRLADGRSPDIACNHWPVAIAMHEANHPDCRHFVEDVYKLNPRVAVGDRRVRFLWASPTCTHFSRAKGASLKDRKIRGLAWSLIVWLKQCRPLFVALENVVEFLGWGPLHNDHSETCDGAHGDFRKGCRFGTPDKARAGKTFEAWVKRIRKLGYSIEWRRIPAWQFGAPTMRERVYIIMRADGLPIEWPEPTHTKETWRTAGEIIDWSIPCPSIFDRARPHVPATRARLAKGLVKYVLEAQMPYLVCLTHSDRSAPHSVDRPLRTVTGANRGEQALVVPAYMIHRSNGERQGQDPRTYDLAKPHPVVVAEGLKTAPVVAFIAKGYSERHGEVMASSLSDPLDTVTAQDHNYLAVGSLTKFYGTSTGAPLDKPTPVVTGGGEHLGVTAAAVLRYNGARRAGDDVRGQGLDAPTSTIDTSNRLALLEAAAVEWTPDVAAKARRVYRFLVDEHQFGPWLDHEMQVVRIPGTDLVVYDLGMRMLVPRELFRAQGFSDAYVIDFVRPDGKPVTKTEQVRAAGNSVCPPVAAAIYRALLRQMRRPRAPAPAPANKSAPSRRQLALAWEAA